VNPKQFLSWLACLNQSPLIMGILNVTPDSFSDGNQFLSSERAWENACSLINQGTDIIDIGGQSTRPGADPVPLEVELNRVIPVIEKIRRHADICISIDTNKPEVMEAAIKAGANVINDVYALRTEGALEMAAQLAVPVCLMHMQGDPCNMQNHSSYPKGVLNEVHRFFHERLAACERVGIKKEHIILDPGFGFGKQIQDNLILIKNLDSLTSFDHPLLLGVSRKSTIGAVLNKNVDERLIGSVAIAVYAALKGVGIIRAHDVDETKQALKMISLIEQVNAQEQFTGI
jgi:dihydropteroate synthase